MKSSNDQQPTPQQGAAKGQQEDPDLLDTVFDSVCPVPDNLNNNSDFVMEKPGTEGKEDNMQEKEEMQMFEDIDDDVQDTAVVKDNDNDENEMVPATLLSWTKPEALAVVESEEVNAESSALEKLAAKFDINCCAKKQTDDAVVPQAIEGDKENGADGDRSLTEIAAKMDEVDLESQVTENDDSLDQNVTKQLQPAWFREPFSAGLIALTGCLMIAVITMAVLLAKK
ncbi:MAG: hypothetical protein SGARI_004798 [Bacillariaceae sp.]